MAYFDNANNAGFYSVSGGPYSYPPPNRTFAIDTEGANNQMFTDTTDQWIMVRGSGSMVGQPTSLQATASSKSVAPATPYTSRTDGCSWPSYDRSADYRQAQSRYSGYLSRGSSFAETTASESSTEYSLEELDVHRSQTVRRDYWGANQSEATTSASYMGGVNTSYWPSTGPARAEVTHTEWYQPYRVSRTRRNGYRNAEAGPSTLVAPPVPYIGRPPTQPSGGISETTANAKTTRYTITEEHRAPQPKRARLPYGKGEPRPARTRSNGVGGRLRDWVGRWRSKHAGPTFNQALAVAAEIVRRKRSLVYSEPHLRTGHGVRTVDSKNARKEFERREVENRSYRRLSRYYEVPDDQVPEGKMPEWARPQLLVKVLEDLVNLQKSGDLEDLRDLRDLQDLEDLEDREAAGNLEDLGNREDLEDPESPEDTPFLLLHSGAI